MQPSRPSIWSHDSNETASGKPGTLQTGVPPGEDKGRLSDLYHLTLLDALCEHRASLKIEWDDGWVAWARYSVRGEHAIIGEVDLMPFARFEASLEGESTWRMQREIERDSRLAKLALSKNAYEHDGQYACTACDFQHPDRAMFDAHHKRPLYVGPRMSKASDLIVLCPVCHRRAHRSANRMTPYSLAELQAWNGAGRPYTKVH